MFLEKSTNLQYLLFLFVWKKKEQNNSISIGFHRFNQWTPATKWALVLAIPGNDVTVAFGAEAGQLELNVMEPVIIYKLFSDLEPNKNGGQSKSYEWRKRFCNGVFEKVCVLFIWKNCLAYVDCRYDVDRYISICYIYVFVYISNLTFGQLTCRWEGSF